GNGNFFRTTWNQAETGACHNPEVALKEQAVKDGAQAERVAMSQGGVFAQSAESCLDDLARSRNDFEAENVVFAWTKVPNAAIEGVAKNTGVTSGTRDVESQFRAIPGQEFKKLGLSHAWLNDCDGIV